MFICVATPGLLIKCIGLKHFIFNTLSVAVYRGIIFMFYGNHKKNENEINFERTQNLYVWLFLHFQHLHNTLSLDNEVFSFILHFFVM